MRSWVLWLENLPNLAYMILRPNLIYWNMILTFWGSFRGQNEVIEGQIQVTFFFRRNYFEKMTTLYHCNNKKLYYCLNKLHAKNDRYQIKIK